MRPSRSASFALAILWLSACTPAPPVSTSTANRAPPAETPEATPSVPLSALAIGPLGSSHVELYAMLELDLQTNATAGNPYNPEEIDIRVEFTSPSGRALDVGAFWYQEFEGPLVVPVGDPGWKVRFTPTETGAWTAVARIPARGLESGPITFQVMPSDSPGFVRIHPQNPRYLAFDNGDFFFPLGLNIAWWTGTGNALTDYGRWMGPFTSNGGNTIRVWMADWSFALEGIDTRLGNYDARQKRAWLLDQIFAMADGLDVYVMLVLLNCADYNNWQTNGWNLNPYNSARGGPLGAPEEFVSDPTARAFLQRKLNYIVNRWGYSPRLLAWEWWNEVNLAPFSDEALILWLQEMTAYLRERDVNRHLTTNSYAIRDLSPIWELPELDIIQKHEYSDQTGSPVRDLAERAASDFQRLAASAPPKPILLGEFGYGGEDRGGFLERTGIHLHNGLWSTTFVGYAGTGMYWFWDVYVAPNSLWHHFRGLDRFLSGVDLASYQPFSPLEISGPGGGPADAVGLGLRGDDLLVWLRSQSYTVQAFEEAGSPSSSSFNPPILANRVLTFRGVDDGAFTVHWYDPQIGRWLDPVEATARAGTLSIPVPAFRRDLAAKIEPHP